MRVQRRIGWIFAVSATDLMMSGCQDSKAARDARLAGIEQMNQGNYEEAIVSFDLALDEADGIVNEFELDVLKYRAEAEYMTEDFTAAAHTYGILADVDDGKPEYFYYQAASEAMAGNLDGAVKAYESALGDTSGAGESDPDRGKEGSEEESAQETDRETDSLQTEEDQTEAAQAGSSQEETETSGDFSAPKQKSIREAALSPEAQAGRSLALSAIGKAYEDQGRYEEAMDFYESAADSGLTADLYNRMGLCMMAAGRYDEAISYFETGMTLNDEVKMPDLKYNEAAAYEYKGNFEKALELLRDWVSVYGSTPEIEKEITFLESR